MKLLTRDQFRESVFARDNHLCVVCKAPAVDSHHLVERRLWPDGGYYIDNGVSVCGPCHMEAESTVLSVDRLRELAGITETILPPHFYSEAEVDKWGNEILPNGQRLKGELFHDESVQKIIKPVLHLFTNRVKYPRTFHLPWSDGASKDDRIADQSLINRFNETKPEVVVTAKMDGESTTLYKDYIHARSLNYDSHPSRNWMKAQHNQIAHDIPDDWRICGENVYAKHSIHYQNLPAYFMVYSIWDNRNVCLSWDDTVEYCKLLELEMVPVLYRGAWDEKEIKKLFSPNLNNDPMEGYVVRPTGSFTFKEFRTSVLKFVRAGHVTSNHNWKHQQVVPNQLREK